MMWYKQQYSHVYKKPSPVGQEMYIFDKPSTAHNYYIVSLLETGSAEKDKTYLNTLYELYI